MLFFLLLLMALPGLCIPRFVLGCVYEAEKRNQLPTQFLMTDTVWLIIVVQISMASLGVYWHPLDMIPFYIFAMIGLPLIWWHSIRVLSRAGVMGFWRRGLFQLVAPLTLVLTITAAASGMAVTMSILERSSHITELAGMILLGSFVVAVALRFLANYIVQPLPVPDFEPAS